MTVVDEHFVPDEGKSIADYVAAGDRTAIHHLIRYQWAMKVLSSGPEIGRLLDIACGSGYGSHMMAGALPLTSIIGADYDENAVEAARARYEAQNLEYIVGDLIRWEDTIGGGDFDVVVSFDTIEHLEHREVMMQNLVDHLSPEGTLLLSTPVRSKPVLNPGWEHHKIEYSPAGLWDFMSRYFEEVLTPDDGTLPDVDVIDSLNSGDEVVYLLRMNPLLCRGPRRLRR